MRLLWQRQTGSLLATSFGRARFGRIGRGAFPPIDTFATKYFPGSIPAGSPLFTRIRTRRRVPTDMMARSVYAEFMPRAELFTASVPLLDLACLNSRRLHVRPPHEGTAMFTLSVAIALMATVAITVLLVWTKGKRQAASSSRYGDAVDTMLALGFVILFLVSFSALTVVMMPAFSEELTTLFAAGLLYVATIAVTLYVIGRSRSIDSPVSGRTPEGHKSSTDDLSRVSEAS